MVEHNNYAMDFINATREIKRVCPGCKISGGVSNIAFSFRGNEPMRRAFHSAFLYNACAAGIGHGYRERRALHRGQVREHRRVGNVDPEVQEPQGGGLPRRAVEEPHARPQGRQRLTRGETPRHHRRDPRRHARGWRRHHRDEHVQRHDHQPGGLRAAGSQAREPHQHRGCEAGEARLRGVDREDAEQAALSRGRHRTDEPHAVGVAFGGEPGVPQLHVRRGGAGVHRAG
ncbi:cobalamin-dependent methionine synthase [Pycnococcus provasolii]